MSNMVGATDVSPTKRSRHGANDIGLHEAAELVRDDHRQAKKDGAMNAKKRKVLYSKEALMPADIFEYIPYEKTLEAIEEGNDEALK